MTTVHPYNCCICSNSNAVQKDSQRNLLVRITAAMRPIHTLYLQQLNRLPGSNTAQLADANHPQTRCICSNSSVFKKDSQRNSLMRITRTPAASAATQPSSRKTHSATRCCESRQQCTHCIRSNSNVSQRDTQRNLLMRRHDHSAPVHLLHLQQLKRRPKDSQRNLLV